MDEMSKDDYNGLEAAVQENEMTQTDAWPFSLNRRRRSSASAQSDAPDVSANAVPAPSPGCERDAEEYNMCHARRGVALIFNHQKFLRMPSRSGTEKDCANLSLRLAELGFDVQKHEDLTCSEVTEVLQKTANQDHSTADCLLVAVMSHGDPGFLHARDGVYQTQDLWTPFTGDECISLVGKPKMFFIQACRGTRIDSGVAVDETDSYAMSYMIPTQADILIAYSTAEGFYSWRNPRQGSWFIQALCEELRINGRTRDILTLLTFVCRRVAIEYQSFVPETPRMDRKKQIPSITSMLTRLVYFRPKK